MAIPNVCRQCLSVALCLIVVMIVGGCSGKRIVTSAGDQAFQPTSSPAPVPEKTSAVPEAQTEQAEVRVEEEPIAPAPLVEPSPLPVDPLVGLSDVYFDFDQYAIRKDARSTLERLIGLLKSELPQGLVIEGHCDERGTIAYNVLLGERRAQAVKRYLRKHGMAATQIQVISYGKERPVCHEHDEACWQSNRRVHFRKP